MSPYIILAIILISNFAYADESAVEDYLLLDSVVSANHLRFENDKGKQANIGFGGDEIIYSGDLPVAESAKIFFEYFGYLCKSEKSK